MTHGAVAPGWTNMPALSALKVKRLTCPGAVKVDVEPPPGPVTPCRSMLCGILLSGMLRRWNWIVSPWRTRMKLPGTVPPKVQKVYVVPSERSEEHTSELQSLMRISYGGFCL